MKFVEYKDLSRYQIKAYEAERVKINDQWYPLPCAVHGQHLLTDWRPTAAQLSSADLQQLLAEQHADLIIVGQRQQPIWDENWLRLQVAMNQQGIGLEQMLSDAAIRTFNVLSTEERAVWLVLT